MNTKYITGSIPDSNWSTRRERNMGKIREGNIEAPSQYSCDNYGNYPGPVKIIEDPMDEEVFIFKEYK